MNRKICVDHRAQKVGALNYFTQSRSVMNAYRIIPIFGVIVLLSAGFVQCSKIHERVGDDETTNHFRVTRDKMSESDMAPGGHDQYKRSDENLRRKFTDYGKTIDAYLKLSDGKFVGANTPVWLAFTGPNGTVEYMKMREGIVGIAVSRFYSNHTQFSTVAVNSTNGENQSFKEARARRSSEAEEEKIRRLERQIREASLSGNKTDASRVKRSDKEIIYPSLLVQTYYKEAKTRPEDLDYYEEIIYQLAFWNAVDLRFRQVNDPEIRIHISGIIIGLNSNAIPYLRSDAVDVNKIWDETLKYWNTMSQREDFSPDAYDIVVTMTDTGTYNSRTSWPKAIARSNACTGSTENRFHSVAIIRDNGGFDGILSAAHALGYYLGAGHDTKSGDECANSHGFIMQSQDKIGPKNLEWSPCSLARLSHSLRRSYMNCFDKPAEFHPSGDPVQKVLPGDVLGPLEQCQGRRYNGVCESTDICTKMECYYTGSRAFVLGFACKNTGPAAEGTPCAPGHKCVEGVCQCMTADCIFIGAEQSARST